MIKKFSPLLFFILFPFLSFSQSGYLGRKLIIKYDLHTNFAFRNPTYNVPVNLTNPTSDKIDVIGLNKINHITLEYLYNRKSSISLFTTNTKTSMLHQKYVKEGIYLYEPHDIRFKVYSYDLGIKHTRYVIRKSGLAPLGLYNTFSISYSYNNIYDQVEYNNKVLSTKINSFGNWAIGYEIGRQQIYYDRLVLSLGIAFRYVSFTSGSYHLYHMYYALWGDDLFPEGEYQGDYDEGDKIKSDEYYSESARMIRNARRRLFSQQFFNIKFGIGFLII